MIVSTPSGQIAGQTIDTPHGAVASFLGVPYAETTGPASRFRPSTLARGHRGVLDGTAPAPAVPQNPDPFGAGRGAPDVTWSEHGSLSANIWAPVGSTGAPVMVWVHGGGYVGGSNTKTTTDGARLAAAEGVVVVALSYRLGVFGFFPASRDLGEGFEDSANLGILDLVTGLEWVRENIVAFGGDPASVTLFGQSAGAAALGTLLGMPRARGLFRRAIMQSGTAERVRTPEQAGELSGRFLHGIGLTPRTCRELLTWPAERLLEAQQAFTDVIARETVGLPLPYQPVIDGRSIHQLPLEAVRAGESSDVDLIVGTNLNEASFFTMTGAAAERTDAEIERALEKLAHDASPPWATGDAVGQYRAALENEIGRPSTPAETLESFLTDVQYRQPSNRLLAARGTAGGNTFAYLFSWASPTMPALGSCHTLELPFVFRQLDNRENFGLIGAHAPSQLSTRMGGAWTGFAASGTPDAPEVPWPAYEPTERRTMAWNADASVATDPRGGLRRWWEDAHRDARENGAPHSKTPPTSERTGESISLSQHSVRSKGLEPPTF